jgi:hypothetical protein
MKIYLAARYSRRDEMKGVASRLRGMGHIVTSRWLDTDWEITERGSSAAPAAYREQYSRFDMDDVQSADCMISFTEEPRKGDSRGGRHVEFGMAVAWNKDLVVVGHRENLFHHLPGVDFYEDTESMLNRFRRTGDLP